MPTTQTTLTATKAEKYKTMLSKHFARKVTVDDQTQYALVHFPMGLCKISAEGDQLSFYCDADSEEALNAVKNIIDRHIPLLKDIRDTELVWVKDSN